MSLYDIDSLAPVANVICDDVDQLDDPLAKLQRCGELARVATTWTAHFVDTARIKGASWSQIGDALGMTRQAAQQRYGA